jgi:primosomal protein N''
VTTKEWAVTYLYEAYNVAEHADRLVQIARHELNDNDRADAALATLRQALEVAEGVPMRIRDAIEKLEAYDAALAIGGAQ